MGTETATRWCQFHGVKEILSPLDYAHCDHCGHVWQSDRAWSRDVGKSMTLQRGQCPLCHTKHSVYRVKAKGEETRTMELDERQRRWHEEMLAASHYVELAENSISRAVDAIPARSHASGPVVDTSEVDSLQAEASVYAAMASMHYNAATAFGAFPR